MASKLFKVTVTQYWLRNCWIAPDGQPCQANEPGARFVKTKRVHKDAAGAVKIRRKSSKWYGRVPGAVRPVPLSSNAVAAQQMLAALIRKAELGKVGIGDPFEAHRKRPLLEHIEEFESDLRAKGCTPKQVQLKGGR